jgi:hypothetical protein
MIRDDKLDAGETASLEPAEKVAPARVALAVGQLDRQDLPPAVLVNRHRHKHRLADDDPGLAHFLIARIQDQIPVALAQPPLGKGLQALIERLVDRADRRGREAVPAQRLGQRHHVARWLRDTRRQTRPRWLHNRATVAAAGPCRIIRFRNGSTF